jgi:serine/threonine-protein kinase
MSDEQRRTSLRHAGAIEFMAPEQNDGSMLFQTDVYSFGIIIYELLAGTVPFPLKDKGETSRNHVMVSHMESPVPDLLSLRKKNFPPNWNSEKREHEINVPHWLISMIYKCLEKKPEKRFANGVQLYEYICLNSTLSTSKIELKGTSLEALQLENQKLLEEKEQLQSILVQYQNAYGKKEQEIDTLRASLTTRDTELNNYRNTASYNAPAQRGVSKIAFAILLLLTLGLGAFAAYTLLFKKKNTTADNNTTQLTSVDTNVKTPAVENRKVIAQYKVAAEKAFFYNQPDESTRRGAYMIALDEATINALEEKNGFVYTEFTNTKGQTSKGWLRKQDLMTLEEWTRKKNEVPQLTDELIAQQLQTAKDLLGQNKIAEALPIYKRLSDADVAEAMFYYGDLALRNKNQNIGCAVAVDLVKRAGDKDYVEAKRTLGFLYLFAESPQMLKVSNYGRCQYEKNIPNGTKLLMEAVLSGDTTAKRILDLYKSTSKEVDNNPAETNPTE